MPVPSDPFNKWIIVSLLLQSNRSDRARSHFNNTSIQLNCEFCSRCRVLDFPVLVWLVRIFFADGLVILDYFQCELGGLHLAAAVGANWKAKWWAECFHRSTITSAYDLLSSDIKALLVCPLVCVLLLISIDELAGNRCVSCTWKQESEERLFRFKILDWLTSERISQALNNQPQSCACKTKAVFVLLCSSPHICSLFHTIKMSTRDSE